MSQRSRLHTAGGAEHLDLATGLARTPDGVGPGTEFFAGFVDRADRAAAGLLAVADVAGTRYAEIGVSQRIAAADPVVTAGGDRLRFESFSLCNGVHARFDLLASALGDQPTGLGTTNVDVNRPLRGALSQMGREQLLHLAVGPDHLRISSPDDSHLEPKVPLPERWVRGLAEVGRLHAAMDTVASMTGRAARRFFADLPRVSPPGPDLHVLPLAAGWRAVPRPLNGTVPLPGASRLRGTDRLLRHTTEVTLHQHVHGATAWVLHGEGCRLTLTLSPAPFRGFSGEGGLLMLLTHPEAEATGRRLLESLAWVSVVDPLALGLSTGLPTSTVDAGLVWLAASGRLGYDLDEQAYFHRELPVDSDAVLRRNPRLVAAQQLLDTDGVAAGPRGRWTVRSSRIDPYVVTSDGPGAPVTCTCRWEREHHGTRGACKHVLAVLLSVRS